VAESLEFNADLGSGCGIFAEIAEPATAWPGLAASIHTAATFANCDGDSPLEWVFGDGGTGVGEYPRYVFSESGVHSWELTAIHGDASLRRRGEVLVCANPHCYQWRPVAEMIGPRLQHSAVVLADGRVLVVGGGVSPEIFDPVFGRWRSIAAGRAAFEFASAKQLADGRVMVTGSTVGNPTNAEIFDPVSETWETTGRMAFDRVMHSSIRLTDGRVLVAGGYFGGDPAVISELYDPATGSWSPVGDIGFEEVPGLALLPDNQVLLVGKRTTRIFNPVTERWRRVSDLGHEHRYGATVALADGRVMVIGGEGTAETEVFDPDLNLWRQGPAMNVIRAVPSAAVLPSGHVVACGGADRFWRIDSKVEVLDPVTGVWTEIQPMAEPRLAHTISVLHDGSIVVTGGTAAVLEEPFEGLATAEHFLNPVQAAPTRAASGRLVP